MEKVTELHKDMVKEMTGPIRQGCSVIIDGRCIPHLHMHDHGDRVELIIDQRFSYTFPREWAYLAASAIAQGMAVGAGFASIHSDEPRGFAPKAINIANFDPLPV